MNVHVFARTNRLRRRLWAAAALFLVLGTAPLNAGADAVSVEAQRDGNGVAIKAQALVNAPHQVVWATLTDYDHLARFIPGMSSSQVLDRQGTVATIEQHGVADLMLFNYPIDVTVESHELAPDRIHVRVLKGNLRRLDGDYRLQDQGPDRTLVTWVGVIEPDVSLPLFLVSAILRRQAEAQFRGLVEEIGRRAHPG